MCMINLLNVCHNEQTNKWGEKIIDKNFPNVQDLLKYYISQSIMFNRFRGRLKLWIVVKFQRFLFIVHKLFRCILLKIVFFNQQIMLNARIPRNVGNDTISMDERTTCTTYVRRAVASFPFHMSCLIPSAHTTPLATVITYIIQNKGKSI